MTAVFPFSGYLVSADRADEIVAPAYDAMSPEERMHHTEKNPNNYINTMRTPEDFPDDNGEECDMEDILIHNANVLRRLIDEKGFKPVSKSCFFVYRLAVDGHHQTGIVADVPVEEYINGGIKIHEHTRRDHEDRLVRYNEVVKASSSPICLTYPHHDTIHQLVENEITKQAPVLDFVTEDGVKKTIWQVDQPHWMTLIQNVFAKVPFSYLTDGHHRAASGTRFAQKKRAENPHYTGNEAFNRLLVALFPDNEMRILSINRCVKDLNGHTPKQYLEILAKHMEVSVVEEADALPTQPRQFTMLLDDIWYRLDLTPNTEVTNDPVASLDVSILQDKILEPILGITDARSDKRLGYIAGSSGQQGAKEHCRKGWRVAFLCYPTTLAQLMLVADSNKVMPPKSTWFDPKVRSGIFVTLR